MEIWYIWSYTRDLMSNFFVLITNMKDYIIQLLTIEALDMMWYRPESTNIDQGGAEVNIGILRSISYLVQCLNSQQLFYYIISLHKKKLQQQQNLGYGLCLGQSSISFFTWWLTDFIQLKEEWMHTLFVITTADREDPDLMPHNVAFHQGLHCLLRQK